MSNIRSLKIKYCDSEYMYCISRNIAREKFNVFHLKIEFLTLVILNFTNFKNFTVKHIITKLDVLLAVNTFSKSN